MTTDLRYPIVDIFWTIQGEGALRGSPMAFLRLAGCSMACPTCDTDYRARITLAIPDIVGRVIHCVPDGVEWPWVWITGGEPTDHDLAPLVRALRDARCLVALATNGSRLVSSQHSDLPLTWLSV